jgi:putative heme iron utilization protein
MSSPGPTGARLALREARTAALGTLDGENGAPYVSLVNIATDFWGWPFIFVSHLAWHTRNLQVDRLASLLVSALPQPRGDALAGSRVTVLGSFEPYADASAPARYLACHPEAQPYLGFPDFSYWRLVPTTIHCVSGFGRIETFAAADVFLAANTYPEFADPHAGAVATDPDGGWSASPQGPVRVNFDNPMQSVVEWRQKWNSK